MTYSLLLGKVSFQKGEASGSSLGGRGEIRTGKGGPANQLELGLRADSQLLQISHAQGSQHSFCVKWG